MPKTQAPEASLCRLAAPFASLESTKRAVEALDLGQQRAVGGLWGSSAALFVAALRYDRRSPILIVTCDDSDSADLQADLASFGVDSKVLVRQEFDIDDLPEPVSRGSRARVLTELAGDSEFLLLASIESLLQRAPDVKALSRGRLQLKRGDRADQEHLIGQCADAGLRKVPVVLAPGEYSARGDVLDVYPLAATEAVRLEFFDDEIESVRTFDPNTQRSLAVLEQCALVLGESIDDPNAREVHTLQHVIRGDLAILFYEPLRIEERKQQFSGMDKQRRAALAAFQETIGNRPQLEIGSLPSHDLDYKILSAGSAVGEGETDPQGRLASIRGFRGAVHIVCRTDAERGRLGDVFANKKLDMEQEQVTLHVGALSRGFRVSDLEVTVLSNVEFAGVPAPTRSVERRELPSRALQSFFELGPGDMVVHAVHGIAMFEGMERVSRGESEEDHMRLRFRDDVHLLVPVSKIHLVQKYVGAGEATPKLDKLGGKGFAKRKEEVQASLFDMASDLLDLQARRERLEREPYPKEDLEDEFLDAFPFQDTEDQTTSWDEIQKDLERKHPMDRLLCGDVGFGKTEMAMRTAFRVAASGRQVGVLVPTTVLAEQHRQNFATRCEPHGLRVEMLSRFKTGKKKQEILHDLALGKVDILIGTHKMLSDEIEFAELGLLIIDEEQRFGVRQKEKLKALRVEVDVLALSATPIPRTLHASLVGVRGISTLKTPPTGRRDVETKVAFRDDNIVRTALHRELSRGGQVFLIYNRIGGLEELREMVLRLAPDARVAIGHGQMTEAQMDKALRAFVRGEFDVLVSTTIVENGLDLPRANTILIDRAEMFGLAELHQLRGRVGRSSEQAYCYLLMDRNHPPKRDAKKRLKALEEFSHLGAGFAIALKDLEIRGAGNLLGPQQSGHIAAIGYEMYCQLLEAAVEQAKRDRPMPYKVHEVDVDLQVRAFLPDDFVSEPKERLELLREMDGASSPTAAQAIRDDLADRFGKLPKPVDNLLKVFLLKHLLTEHGVEAIQRPDKDRVVVRHPAGRPLGGAWVDRFDDARAVEAGKTHLILPAKSGRKRSGWTGEQTLEFLLTALTGKRG